MAVSFKVPASPKRDIFVIDNFMGVDLTNTGSNIDEVRSPNAENMVRYVPGKVRKRTGYSVQVEFSEGKDVNRVLGTSDEWVNLDILENGQEQEFLLQEEMSLFSIYIKIQAIGEYKFSLYYHDGESVIKSFYTMVGTEEHPYDMYRYSFNSRPVSKTLFKIGIESTQDNTNGYIRVKGLRVCHATRATSYQGWNALPWKPAPEDEGRKFILCSSTDIVYGHHTLKTGKKQGDFVTDVNRALGTSSSSVSHDAGILYELGEPIPKGKTVHISFDYDSAGSNILACTNPFSETGDTIASISGTGSFDGDYTALHDFTCLALSGYSSSISNFMLSYAASDDPSWSVAPEENGATFDVSNVYQATGDNTAIFSSKSETILYPYGGSQFSCPVVVQQSTTAVKGALTIAEFNVTATISKMQNQEEIPVDIDAYELIAEFSDGSTEVLYYNAGAIDSERFKLYLKPDSGVYLEKISLQLFAAETTSVLTDCTVNMKNLSIHEGIEKTDFMSSAYINLYHVGRKLYVNKSGTDEYTQIYSFMNQQRSVSWQFEARDNESALLGHDNLYIVDGSSYLEYNGARETIDTVDGNGRIPLVTIAKSPSGGGTPYYAVNRLQPGFEEQFIGDGSATNYQLSFTNLNLSPSVRVWVMDQDDGSWIEKEETVDFTVNYGLGIVFFTTAPWDATIAGEDNVKIRAYRTVDGYADSINKCSFGTLFGVGGASDRLFLSGNPDTPNYDYYSDQYDPTYFPDTFYSTLGVGSSAVKGYARVNNYLATFKDENEPSQSVFIREGDFETNSTTNLTEPIFKLINTLQGNGAISPYTFGYLQTEPLFLTKSGIYAITAQDITGEKYGQSRSFYLNGGLLDENDLEDACSVVYNDQYILAINNHLYILDGLQPVQTDRSAPYSTRQYAAFYCTNVPAYVMWLYEDALWFGTTDGRICKFATDIDSLESYNDNGDAIYACWETPDLDGKLFYKNKTFRYFAARMMSAMKTSVQMWSQRLGEWTFIKETTAVSKIFDFNDIDFTIFSFRSDSSEKVAHAKVRVKKVDKARFRLENGKLNEPFGLFDLALEYVESGNYKR